VTLVIAVERQQGGGSDTVPLVDPEHQVRRRELRCPGRRCRETVVGVAAGASTQSNRKATPSASVHGHRAPPMHVLGRLMKARLAKLTVGNCPIAHRHHD
jgi:hypothetical protein